MDRASAIFVDGIGAVAATSGSSPSSIGCAGRPAESGGLRPMERFDLIVAWAIVALGFDHNPRNPGVRPAPSG